MSLLCRMMWLLPKLPDRAGPTAEVPSLLPDAGPPVLAGPHVNCLEPKYINTNMVHQRLYHATTREDKIYIKLIKGCVVCGGAHLFSIHVPLSHRLSEIGGVWDTHSAPPTHSAPSTIHDQSYPHYPP